MEQMKQELRRKQMLSVMIFTVIQMLSLISPYIMGAVIDDYIPNRRTVHIAVGIVVFVTVPFVSVLLQTGYNYFLIKYVRKKGNEFGLSIMEKLIYQEKAYFDKEKSMELLSYTSKEATGYINFYIAELSKYYVNVIISVVTFIILCMLHPVLGAIQLLYLPLAYLPVQWLMRNVDREVQAVLEKNAELAQIKGDIFKAIEFIKLNRLEHRKLWEIDKKNQSINGIWGKIAALDTLSGIWTSGFAMVLFTGITFGAGTLFILSGNGGLQAGQLISIITYGSLFYSNVNSVLQMAVDKKKKEGEYSKIFSYLEFEGEQEKDAGKELFTFQKKIEFTNCDFSYNKEEFVLKNCSMIFKKGSFTGIVGSSGSGKSTILDIIMKLYEVADGNVRVDAVDINRIDRFSIREQVTKIAQDVFLFPGTLEDNLKLVCPAATKKDMEEALEFACLKEYVEALPNGIKTDVGEAGKLMSGGERQRLSIAMGILRKNKIILLDEVTANLDNQTEARLAENFHLLAKQGITIIAVSHRIEFLKYADTVYEVFPYNNEEERKVRH